MDAVVYWQPKQMTSKSVFVTTSTICPFVPTDHSLNTQSNDNISPPTVKSEKGKAHPLDSFTSDEVYIAAVSLSIREYIAQFNDIHAVKFITCSVAYPPKKDVLAYLGIPLQTGEELQPWEKDRQLLSFRTKLIDIVNGAAFTVIASLSKDAIWLVDSVKQLPEGVQPQISVHELGAAEEIVRNDPTVIKLAAEIGSNQKIFTRMAGPLDGILGFLRVNVSNRRSYLPGLRWMIISIPILSISLQYSILTFKVIHVDFPPHRVPTSDSKPSTTTIPSLTSGTSSPPPLDQDSLLASGRKRIPYPDAPQEYLLDMMEKYGGVKPSTRKPLKLLHIVQPEGVSFTVDVHEIEWQKWKMYVDFSRREGIVLSTITYDDDGVLRPLIYCLSPAEMIVPYGIPELPHPRKFAFDVGEYGVGCLANDLTLVCDCLGKIHHLPGSFIGQDGHAINIQRAICIHEEDHGLLWKHTDYRTGGRAHAVRSRDCVTLFAPSDPIPNPFATQVAPRMAGQFHQHIFSIRIDPMIDGLNNSVLESDVILLDAETGSDENCKVLKKGSEGGREYDHAKERRSVLGFRGHTTTLLAKPNSWIQKRAAFASKSLWVVKDVDDGVEGRMWPAGRYVPQTRDARKIRFRNGPLEKRVLGERILWYSRRSEQRIFHDDWPGMLVDSVRLSLKPVHFFEANPSLDVPLTQDNVSALAFENRDSTTGNGYCN
ncbi:hypothetical protein M422DRAFT_239272 [Sphaerobolus stellatus SS14]|nr:hypothetical protein M422DRAFT_239272 [Sphaerobolus stellatus SS14]